jgi:hypothetical protein
MLHTISNGRSIYPCFFSLALAACGCGGEGDLRGKVTFNGKIVSFGTVLLVAPDGLAKVGPIQADGSFHISKIPLGEVQLAVNSPDPQAMFVADAASHKGPATRPPAVEGDPSKWFPLPAKYRHVATSELKYTIKKGENIFDLELKE